MEILFLKIIMTVDIFINAMIKLDYRITSSDHEHNIRHRGHIRLRGYMYRHIALLLVTEVQHSTTRSINSAEMEL